MDIAYELYYMPTCPYCRKVLRYLDQHGIQLPLHDISASTQARATLERVGGKIQVPCLFIDGKPLYESDDIISYLDQTLVEGKKVAMSDDE